MRTTYSSVDAVFGARLKATREQRCISRTTLARKVGVTGPAVTFWEQGSRRPKPDLIPEIAKALGVTEAYLQGVDPRSEMALPSTLQEVISMARLSASQVMGVPAEQVEIEVRVKG